MALTKIRGNAQVQDLSITNAQIADKDVANPDGILLSKIEDGELLVKSDGSVSFTDPVAGVTPTQDTHLATKGYVDATAQGLDAKESVRALATVQTTLSGTQTIDGVSLVDGDRVLLTGQTNPAENGIYVVHAGAWLRAADATTGAQVTPGMFTFVEEGTTFSDTGWVLTSDGPTTLGTTALPFVQFSAAGQVVAGAGMTKTGNTLDVVSSNGGIVVNANDIALTLDGSTLSVGPSGLKLANASSGQVLIAGAGGAFAPQTISGDVTISNTGVVSIVDGAVNGDAITDGTLDLDKLVSGTAGQIIVAGAGGVPAYVTLSGDATINAAGSLQLAANSVGSAEIANSAVGTTELADDAVTADKLATDSVTADALADDAVDTAAIVDEAVTLGKLFTVPAGQIIMGTAGGNATVTLSGDVTVDEDGVVTINAETVVRVADIIKGETPAGALNGVNTTFVLAAEPKVGTVDVFVNGILQDAGAGNDYTISGDEITMLYALTSADKIRVSYFK